MPTPGSNLLRRAARLIKLQTVGYYMFMSRELNRVKQWVSAFAPSVDIQGSVQAVPRNKYSDLGLDLQRDYVNLFAAKDIQDIDRDRTGDQFTWQNKLYQIESQTDWYAQDGWVECLAVKIGTGVLPNLTAPFPVRVLLKAQ